MPIALELVLVYLASICAPLAVIALIVWFNQRN